MKKLALATAASLLVAIAVAAAAQAEPGGPDGANLQAALLRLHGASGNTHEFRRGVSTPGAAWHLTDSRQIFVAMIGFDETANTQVMVTPGF